MGGRDWINMPQAKDTLRVFVNTVMNFGFHKMRRIYWLSYNFFLEKDCPTGLAYVKRVFLVHNIASNGTM